MIKEAAQSQEKIPGPGVSQNVKRPVFLLGLEKSPKNISKYW